MKKAFTLIELLVVIAIIGILSAMVLVSLSTARNKAKDTRIKGDVSQTKIDVESWASGNGGSFANYVKNTTLDTDVKTQNGGAVGLVVNVSSSAYAIGADLNGTTTYICTDSTGQTLIYPTSVGKTVTSGLAALTACPTGGTAQ